MNGSVVIGAVGTTAGIVAALFAYLQYRQGRKDLRYSIISRTPLIEVGKDVTEQVEIYFDGQLVENLELAIVEFKNLGSSISPKAFEDPIRIDMGDDANVLAVSVVDSYPKHLRPSMDVSGGQILLHPVLLNKGSKIRFRAIGANFSNVEISSMIHDVIEIREFQENFLLQSQTELARIITKMLLSYVLIILIIVLISWGVPGSLGGALSLFRNISLRTLDAIHVFITRS